MTDNLETTQNTPEAQHNPNMLIAKPFVPPVGPEMTPEELEAAEKAHYIEQVLAEYFPDYNAHDAGMINLATYQRDRLNQSAQFALMMGATGRVDERTRQQGKDYYRQEDTIRVAECASAEELQRFMAALATLQQKFTKDLTDLVEQG